MFSYRDDLEIHSVQYNRDQHQQVISCLSKSQTISHWKTQEPGTWVTLELWGDPSNGMKVEVAL